MEPRQLISKPIMDDLKPQDHELFDAIIKNDLSKIGHLVSDKKKSFNRQLIAHALIECVQIPHRAASINLVMGMLDEFDWNYTVQDKSSISFGISLAWITLFLKDTKLLDNPIALATLNWKASPEHKKHLYHQVSVASVFEKNFTGELGQDTHQLQILPVDIISSICDNLTSDSPLKAHLEIIKTIKISGPTTDLIQQLTRIESEKHPILYEISCYLIGSYIKTAACVKYLKQVTIGGYFKHAQFLLVDHYLRSTNLKMAFNHACIYHNYITKTESLDWTDSTEHHNLAKRLLQNIMLAFVDAEKNSLSTLHRPKTPPHSPKENKTESPDLSILKLPPLIQNELDQFILDKLSENDSIDPDTIDDITQPFISKILYLLTREALIKLSVKHAQLHDDFSTLKDQLSCTESRLDEIETFLSQSAPKSPIRSPTLF